MRLAFFLSLAASASADIIYLADCFSTRKGTSFLFSGAIFYTGGGAGSGELNPSTSNIGIGQQPWQSGSSQNFAVFPDTRELLVINGPLKTPPAPVGTFAGTASNAQGTFNCRLDLQTQSVLFNNGFITCFRDYYCQPVGI
ncbi:hypothetical protein NA57DRAFT_52804 [Rhizodiscina lignyota]|uniref:Uncharacterized protein n=1 Tax=Rhizodiscina lignyota TaxID=1504668 RepID=A0A9P4IRP7_9PEZI|nr:hypothetical protein NA57DRAFT_52804 [Rhizodiscina lignyota]